MYRAGRLRVGQHARAAGIIWPGWLGRRTAREMASLGWSADPTTYLATWFIFGPQSTPLGAP